ncbi:MAG: hypothetical protein ACI9WU_002555 [Myxococcota bacterium]
MRNSGAVDVTERLCDMRGDLQSVQKGDSGGVAHHDRGQTVGLFEAQHLDNARGGGGVCDVVLTP